MNGKKEGYGIWFLMGGNRYEGEFKNDAYNGKGIYFWVDGDRYEG